MNKDGRFVSHLIRIIYPSKRFSCYSTRPYHKRNLNLHLLHYWAIQTYISPVDLMIFPASLDMELIRLIRLSWSRNCHSDAMRATVLQSYFKIIFRPIQLFQVLCDWWWMVHLPISTVLQLRNTGGLALPKPLYVCSQALSTKWLDDLSGESLPRDWFHGDASRPTTYFVFLQSSSLNLATLSSPMRKEP